MKYPPPRSPIYPRLFIFQTVNAGLSYAGILLLVGLGEDVYGQWVLLLLLTQYAIPWGTLGMAAALIRFLPPHPRSIQQILYGQMRRAGLWAGLSLAAIVVLLAVPISAGLLGGCDWKMVALAAPLIPLEIQLQLGNSFLQAQEKFVPYARLSVGRSLLEVGGMAAVAATGGGVALLLWLRLLAVVLCLGTLRWITGPSPFSPAASRSQLRQWIFYGLPLVPANLLWEMVTSADRWMLAGLGPVATVAHYSFADRLAVLPLNFTKPINLILQPQLAKLQHRPGPLRRHLSRAFVHLGIVLIPCVGGLCFFAGDLVEELAGPTFQSAAAMLPLLALSRGGTGLLQPWYYQSVLHRGGGVMLGLFAGCLVVSVLFNLLLIPPLGGLGAAWASLATTVFYGVGLWGLSKPRGNN